MKRKKIITYLFLSLLFITCKNTVIETNSKELIGDLWILDSFEENGTTIIPLNNQDYNIQFFADSTLKGRSDCNEIIGGKYSLSSNKSIQVIDFGTTKIYCGENSKGDKYSTAISQVHSYSLDKNILYLYFKENSKMVFN